MEIHFTPERQVQLAQIAMNAGTAPERLVTNAVARYLEEESRSISFRAGKPRPRDAVTENRR